MRRTHGALSTGTALVGLSSNCSEFENPTVCSWKIVKLPAPNAWSNSPRLQPKQRASIFNSPRNVTATPDCPHPPYSALRKSKPSPLSAQVSKATQSANAIRICSRASRRQAGSSPGWEDGTATINPLVPSPCDVAWNSSTQSIAVANSVNPGRCCNEKCESPSVRLEQSADCGSVRCAGGYGSAVAQRLWQGGVDAIKASIAPGPPPVQSATALRVWSRPYSKSRWRIDRTGRLPGCVPRSKRVRVFASAGRNCPRRCEKKFRWRRPRHTLKGRQTASEVDRIGLRLQLRKRQAEAGDIVLLYGDESEALTHPYLARAWAKSGADLRVPAPGQAKKVAMLGSLDHVTRQLTVHTSPTKRSTDFVAHLEQLDDLYGPKPGRTAKPVVLVEDNGPIHVSKRSLAALAARAHRLTVEWLPKYAPELNDIEVVWHDLKAHHLAHQTFTDVDALDQAIHAAVQHLNHERMVVPLARLRISA